MNTKILFKLLVFSFLMFSKDGFTQSEMVRGIVLEKKANGKTEPIIGATLRWENAKNGTSTDKKGEFSLNKSPQNHELIVSSVGYRTDTLMVHSLDYVTIYLTVQNSDLQEVVVKSEATSIDKMNPIHTEIITTKALAKAACCNLSESFETNASVSVSYSDAITGSKQIQLLGLSGNYIQTNVENIPSIRGLNTAFGLNYIPGTWLASIDVAKGAGSVVNGYESMTGALNIELAKPDMAEKLYLNAYGSSQGRGEINLNLANKINKKWSVGLLTHASTLQTKLDQNNDGFLDLPLYTQFNGINRWKYQSDKMMAQFGVKALYEDRTGGQVNFNPNTDRNSGKFYGFGSKTQRYEFFSKTAKLYQLQPYKGLGLIINGLVHDNVSYFGFKNYTGTQKSLYANLIYQNIIDNTNHQYKAGLSYLLDDYNEKYIDSTFKRMESVPGAFVEYTETIPEKLTVVIGGRVDFHNLYGTRFTPRFHLKYDVSPNSALRLSAGKGWRMPNAISENFGMLVNSRQLSVNEVIRPEESWNFGISFSNDFYLFGKKGTLILDAYRTDFQNQLIVDMENADYVRMYNLKGRSFSNSFQAEINYAPMKRMDLKLAYRVFDVQNDVATPSGELTLLPKQFVNRDRFLLNLGYATKYDKWKFDITWQWNGKRRIPDFAEGHVHSATSPTVFAPAFSNINAQITKAFYKWEMYVGGENLNNFTQKDPILSAKDPFSKNFDASMVWGPVIGRMVYVGMRYKIK
ncbi:outer membrane receptor protein involved in Fe transport [Arcicella aurantiaca]|uniref:Outer membrane receptor protein involved in Fe transport n=1 Tax=Arcicella aurantiaca TaxID=591202 RepID=A0A316EBL5_9BACT|nr:TonB-dependent receptor [Arcicella aurantiaca]PWK27848.1 outer membrane receptor protein involved in Fe transport [Arcicella aurantiaca]